MTSSLLRLLILRNRCPSMSSTIALTRLPSNGALSRCSVQTYCRFLLSHRQPFDETMRSMVLRTCSSSQNCMSVGLILPWRSTQTLSGALTIISVTSGSQSNFTMGPNRSRSSAINLAVWRWSASSSSEKTEDWHIYSIARSWSDDAVGCLVGKGVLDLRVAGTVGHDFCYSAVVFTLDHCCSLD